MAEENRTIHPSEEVIESVSTARETYAPVVKVPFSPTGLGIDLKHDVDLIGRAGRVVRAGLYPILSANGELGYIDQEGLGEQLSSLIEEKKKSGDYEETEIDGKRAGAISGEVKLKLDIKPLVLGDRAVNAIEVFVSIAIYTSETEDDARELFNTFYSTGDDSSKGDTGLERDSLPKIDPGSIEKLDYPLDKVNGKIWTLIESGSIPNGKIDVARTGSKTQIPVFYSVDFSKLEEDGVSLSKKLEPYDERVYIAAAALYNTGREIMTLQQIYSAMGYSGDASFTDNQKINDSLTKMARTIIRIDNRREAETYKYDHFTYDGYLLPMERVTAMSGGNITGSAIHVFREPPAITFARQRKQITTVDVHLLESPLSKTDANIRLEDYLIRRIARIKKDGSKTSNKILFETVFKNVGAATSMQRTRTRDKIKKLLEHYKQKQFVKNFKVKNDGVEIFY